MGMSALEVRRRVMLAQPHEAVASGAVASFRTDVVSALPMEFDLVPIQAGTGDPSPENVRPITGHDGFTRTGTGKNLWNFLKSGQDINPSGVDTTNKTIQIRAYDDRNKKITNGLKFKENTQYTVILKLYRSNGTTSGTSYGSNVGVEYTDGTKTAITYVSAGDSVFVTTVFTTNATKNVKCISVYNNSGFSYIKYEESGIFEGVLTADQFAAYSGHSYETEFDTPPGTVYGGHVTDNGDGTGTLVVDRAEVTFNGTQGMGFYEGTTTNRLTWNDYITIGETNTDFLSDTFATSARSSSVKSDPWLIYNGNNAPRMFMTVPKSIASVEDFNEYAEQHPINVVYYLATPQTYTLPMTAIQSLIGQNNVWVDNADEVSVEYWGH